MKKGLSLLLSLLMVVSMFSCLSVVASATLTLQTDTEYTVLDGEKGVFIAPEAGYYLFTSNGNGSCGVSIYVEGQSSSVANWACEYKGDFYGTIYLEKNQPIECSFTNYVVGEDYITFTITKVDNPIESIEFEFAEGFAYIENTLCYPATDDNGDHYTHYDTPSAYFFGNTLTVNRVDGTSTSYVYTENVRVTDEEGYSHWSDEWVSSDGAILEFSDGIEIYDIQQEEHWGVGLENLVHVSYLCYHTTTSLPMIKNPVESISFTVINPEDLTIIKEYNGRWEERYNDETDEYEDFYNYNNTDLYEVGNVLTVNYTDGTSVDYIYSMVYNEVEDWYDYDWYSEDGKLLDYSITKLYFSSDQFTTPWVLGSNNFITVEYMFKEYKIPVTIVENPVESIEFTPKKAYEFVENLDGYWDERYNEETGEDEEYFYYQAQAIYNYDNALTVNYTDGSKKVFVFDYAYDEEYGDYRNGWFSADGYIGYFDVSWNMNQYDKPWVIGGDNYITVEYMGRECQVPVTIKANPVESIEFIPKNGSLSVFEETHGYWQDYWDDDLGDYVNTYYEYDFQEIVEQSGNAVKVNYTNGTTSTYYYSSFEEGWINENDQLLNNDYLGFWATQYEGNSWAIGNNSAKLSYYGKEIAVTVKVLEPVDDVTDGIFVAEVISPTECMISEIDLCAIVDGTLTIPETIQGYKVTSIESWVLYSFGGIKEINLPASFTNISQYTLNGCYDLERVNVAENNPVYASKNGIVYNKKLTVIVYVPDSFKGELYIPAGVETLDSDVLAAMGNASSIVIDENNPNFVVENGIVYNSDFTKIIKAISLPENYVMKSTVTEIGEYAFSGNTTIKTATVNNTVTEISYGAFSGCSALESVAMPEGLVGIGCSAFKDSGLKSVALPSTVQFIDEEAFANCKSLTSVSLNDGLEKIFQEAFINSGITSVVIPDSVTDIRNNAFCNCDSLTNVVIGKGITVLDSETFCNCDALVEFYVPANVEFFSAYEVSGCSNLERIIIDSNNPVYSSKDGVLFNKNGTRLISCPDGKKGAYTIPDGVTSISNSAFDNAAKITSVVIPEGVTTVDMHTFMGCTALQSVTLPSTIESIQNNAFEDCSSLQEIYITENISWMAWDAFRGCTALKAINVSEANANYASQNGILYDKSKTTLMLAPSGMEGEVVVPQGTTEIQSFAECDKITSIVLPEGVTSIGGEAFNNCTSLEKINLPDSVTYIAYTAFYNCSSLKTVRLPSQITEIAWSTFEYCESLEAIEIPASVTLIEEDAFWNCTSLKDVYYTGTEEQWNAIEIEYGNEDLLNATIHFNSTMSEIDTTPTLNLVGDTWYYMAGNKVLTDYTGLVNYYDVWYYVENGVLNWNYTGLTNYYDVWYYVENGVLNWNYTGLTNYYDVWYYVENGVLNWGYTGLAYHYGSYYYVENGALNWNYTGLVYHYGAYYYVENGILNWNYTGLVYHYGAYYYVEGGILNWNYTGLVYHYGAYYYVEGGILNWNYTGLVYHYGAYYYVEGGALNWNYTGLTCYYDTWYYVENGVLNWGYTGYTNYYGTYYYITNGWLDWSKQ